MKIIYNSNFQVYKVLLEQNKTKQNTWMIVNNNQAHKETHSRSENQQKQATEQDLQRL